MPIENGINPSVHRNEKKKEKPFLFKKIIIM